MPACVAIYTALKLACICALYFAYFALTLLPLRGAIETPAAANACGVTPAAVAVPVFDEVTTVCSDKALTLPTRFFARQSSHHNINGLAI